MPLTEKQMSFIRKLRRELIEKSRQVPESGIEIDYLGKKFIVYRNVFWPQEDSRPLVENFTINPCDHVLDVCTGSEVIAIFSAYRGAGRVVAVDINPGAVRSAKENAMRHGFSKIIDVRLSDMFDALGDEEFDVVTANLPFTDELASDFAEMARYDADLATHRKFFGGLKNYLKPGGRAYVSQANYGAVEEMKALAKSNRFAVRLVGEKHEENDPRVFYAFELKHCE